MRSSPSSCPVVAEQVFDDQSSLYYSPSTSLVFIDNEKKIDYHLILLMLSVTETM